MVAHWEKLGYLIAGKYRAKVMACLSERPMTPKQISEKTGLYLSHVSLTLKELMKIGLVESLTPGLRRGRLYGLTKNGKEILNQLNRLQESGSINGRERH